MKLITVVIPAYNCHDTIEKTLFSIINQSIVDQIQVIIVNDKSKKGYKKIADNYTHLVDIRIINLTENRGPGVARQKGLEACQTPYITFIDGDDVYLDSLFMDGVITYLDQEFNCTNVNVMFLEERENGILLKHGDDNTWMFGKIYRVDYLRKNNIEFSDLRSNEDLEFNFKILLTQKNQEYTHYINDKQVYLWKIKENSITRINDREYSYHQGIIGGMEAKIRGFKFSNIDLNTVSHLLWLELPYLYNNFISILGDRPDKKEWLNAVFEKMLEFYYGYIRNFWIELNPIEQAHYYNTRSLKQVTHIIPSITFHEFIAKLEAKEL